MSYIYDLVCIYYFVLLCNIIYIQSKSYVNVCITLKEILLISHEMMFISYNIIGMMHVSTSFQIVFISSWLKSLLPDMLNMVCNAASVFPFVFFDMIIHCPFVVYCGA